jgi:tyrosine-protein phosphatase YwqE
MERYRCLLFQFSRIDRLRQKYNVLLQMNCSTAIDAGSFWRRKYAEALIRSKRLDFIASDAHDASRRTCKMREAYEAVKRIAGETYARRVTSGIIEDR